MDSSCDTDRCSKIRYLERKVPHHYKFVELYCNDRSTKTGLQAASVNTFVVARVGSTSSVYHETQNLYMNY